MYIKTQKNESRVRLWIHYLPTPISFPCHTKPSWINIKKQMEEMNINKKLPKRKLLMQK